MLILEAFSTQEMIIFLLSSWLLGIGLGYAWRVITQLFF
jgi:hypothetical protein